MPNYNDNKYTAINDTILFYCGKDISLTVPEKLGNMKIISIGDGAFMESDFHQVILQDGIKRLGNSSFLNCKNLSNVFIPYTVEHIGNVAFGSCNRLVNLNFYDYRLNKAEYCSLINRGVRLKGKRYLLSDINAFENIKETIDSLSVRPANPVKNNIGSLFTSQSESEEKGLLSLYRNLDGFGFYNSERYSKEVNEFEKMDKEKNANILDRESEKSNDGFIKTERKTPIEKTALVSLDDTKTKVKDELYTVFINIKIGYHFWQSGIPVFENGKKYFVYRRHYLTSLPNLDYLRKDVAVFGSDNAVIDDRKEAERVYAKYRLLSIL